MNTFQWIAVVFCSFQLLLTLIKYHRARYSLALFYAFGWLIGIILLVHPTISTNLANLFGIGRGADLVLYLFCILFFWGHYQHYVRYKRLEEYITTLVREFAIEKTIHEEERNRQ